MQRPMSGDSASEPLRATRRICSSMILVLAGLLAILPLQTPAAQTLRVGVPGNGIGTLDPHRATASMDVNVVNWLFNGLVRIKPGQIDPSLIEPDIAESWTSSDGGRQWMFKLRSDVHCHGDYGPLTADDVVYSLLRASARQSSSFFADYAAFHTVEALDPGTVKITLHTPVPSLLGLLVPYHGGNIVCRKAVERLGDAFARLPVGTGPFQVAEYDTGRSLRLVANSRYFRGAPQIREINVRYIESGATIDLAFAAGELDLVNGRSEESWIRRIARQRGTSFAVLGPAELHSLHLNTAQKPLQDWRVRRAISHAIDREALVRFRGEGVAKSALSVVPRGYLGAAEVALPQHDPAEAKRLLNDAGHPQGIRIKAIQTTLSATMATMVQIQSQLKASGIELELVPVDHPTFHSQIRQNLSQVVYYGAARFPIADIYLTQFFDSASIVGRPGAVTNFSHCSAADDEIRAARHEPSPSAQLALWRTAQAKIVDAICAIPLFELGQPWAWTDRLHFAYPLDGSLGLSPPIDETTRLVR